LLDDIGDANGAIPQYLAAIRLQPNNPYTHRNLGIAYYRNHDLESAESAFRRALRLSPHYWLARISLLQLLMETNEPEAALAELREAIRLDRREFLASLFPDLLPIEQDEIQRAGEEAVTHFCLGLLFVRVKDTDKAIKEIQHALLLDSNFALGHQALAVMYVETSRLAEGLSAFQSALRVNPNLPNAHLRLGELYSQQGRRDEALTVIQAAIRAAPNRPEAYIALGFLYWELARPEDALASLRRALALTEPKSQQAGQAHFALSLVYGRIGQFAPAWKHFHEAQRLGANIPQEHGAAGWATSFVKAIACNWLVTTGTVLAFASRSTAGKIAAMWLPIAIFFAHGYEHSVVNMFVIPAGMLLGARVGLSDWWLWNQIPVTLGNILGGAVFTGLALWYTHGRAARKYPDSGLKSPSGSPHARRLPSFVVED
jgi:tetratricopeptide (TPR) repeat protein